MKKIIGNKYAINWFLPIFIVFAQYSILIGYSIGLLMFLILSIYTFIKYKSITINKWVIIFIVTCILIQLIIHRNSTGINTFFIALISILVLSGKIDENKLFKYFKIFGSIAIIGMLYHSILTYVFGMHTSPIRILPQIGGNSTVDWFEPSLRPTSFFTEPQGYASYMMPFLFISLKKSELKWAIPITVSVLLSTSSQGIIMMLILWGGYVMIKIKDIKSRVSILSVMSLLIMVFLFTPIFEFSRKKLIETEIDGNPRLSRGFDIFKELKQSEKIFGIGYGNVGDYVIKINYRFEWGIGNESITSLNYTSGMSGVMIQFGLVGLIVLLAMFYNLWIKSSSFNRVFLLMIFASFFSQNLLLNAWFLYFFMFYLGISNFDKKRLKRTAPFTYKFRF